MVREAQRRDEIYGAEAFQRLDERDDRLYYEVDRMVPHLDEEASAVVTEIIRSLVVEENPRVLDLMASWDSHLPEDLEPSSVVGLGLNPHELEANPALDQRLIHDINDEPDLPLADATFDVVLNTVSVDYLTRPFEVVDEYICFNDRCAYLLRGWQAMERQGNSGFS